MEKSTGRKIRLGMMVVASMLLLTVAAYLIGQKRDLFSKTFPLRAVFNNVNGLQIGNNVRFGGINVGSVIAISIENDSTIEVVLRIKEKVRPYIKKNAFVSIGTDGLMGNMLVNISPGTGPAEKVENNDLLAAYSRIKTDDILKTLNVTNENAAILTANLLEMTQDIMHGTGVVSYLLYDTLLRERLGESVRNLALTTRKTNELVVSVHQITSQLAEGNGLAGWILTDTISQQKIGLALQQLNLAAQDINQSAISLKALIGQVKEGEGAIPTLMTDTTMVSDLRQTLIHLNQGTKKFDENMEALKHSFLTRKYFKNEEKKKDKALQK